MTPSSAPSPLGKNRITPVQRMRLICLSAISVAHAVTAAPLQDARVTCQAGTVEIAVSPAAAHPSVVGEAVNGTATIVTGDGSRVELLFPDRTVARLGGQTRLHFKPGTRTLFLDQGTLLVQVPALHGGV